MTRDSYQIWISLAISLVAVVVAVLVAIRKRKSRRTPTHTTLLIADLVEAHFLGLDPEQLATQVRVFPERMRADVQAALDAVLGTLDSGARVLGVHRQFSHETIEFPALLDRDGDYSPHAGPVQFIEVDVGDDAPRRCMKTALWFPDTTALPHAVLMSPALRHGTVEGIHVEVAVAPGEAGTKVAAQIFSKIEEAVKGARSYRGKVLSLEQDRNHYAGRSTGIKVHRLRPVAREELILPARTLALLESNVFGFHARRADLRRLGLSTKKGLLFHGPPGTGKTHTIHYLASRLVGHTTLVITAEQVALLDEYMALARLLAPSVVVIEDADLIARERTSMESTCEEVLLNKLLNQMDGLREDAEVLFILTTNRPEMLEPALASRPGRIDQAIEFPLPDSDGRKKLVRLYARGLQVEEAHVETIASRTNGASAAFIKELMRRTAQAALERDASGHVRLADVDAALEEMLFRGGQLNVRILGGQVDPDPSEGDS